MTKEELIQALVDLRSSIQWRPGKGERHVRTRQRAGHLPDDATLEDYEDVIRRVVSDPSALVYRYDWSDEACYPVCVAVVDGRTWLVMTGMNGVMETAFVMDRPNYLDDPRYVELGLAELEEG